MPLASSHSADNGVNRHVGVKVEGFRGRRVQHGVHFVEGGWLAQHARN